MTSTRTDLGEVAYAQLQNKLLKQKEKTPKQQCEENGGFWDPVAQTCLMAPKGKAQEPTMPAQEETKKETLLGAPGRTLDEIEARKMAFFKAKSPRDTREFLERSGLETNEAKAFRVQQEEQMAQEQQMKIQALQGLGLSDNQIAAIQSGLVEAPIDWGQALTAGAIKGAIPTALGYAAAGAGAGAVAGLAGGPAAPVTVPTAALIGGGIGLLKGVYSQVVSNIAQQQKGELGASVDVLTQARTNMRRLSTLAAKDPQNAVMYIEAYNSQLAQVYQAERKIQLETQGNLNKFMEDGTDILSDFEIFLRPGGQAEIYRRQLELSLTSGIAPDFTLEDFE